MSYCKYHPLLAATNHCPECRTDLCKDCCDDDTANNETHCLLCDAKTKSLGVTADIEPFWRHLQESFRYPLQTNVIFFVLIVSFLSVLLSFIPGILVIGAYLGLTGVMVKYCFNCLTETAEGKMKAPDITTAYEGGVDLVLRLFIAMVLMVAAVYAIAVYIGSSAASFVGIFLIFALPAMIILYAMTEDLSQALNPLKMLSLMQTIGMPYLVILGILIVMISSVQVLHELLWSFESIVSLTLQSVISNYYAIVMFHLMGYMIFQYQHRLGFVAEHDTGEDRVGRTAEEKYLSRIQILIKEGQFNKAEQVYRKSLKECPNDDSLNNAFLQFALAMLPQSIELAREAADCYFSFLIRNAKREKLYLNFKNVRHAIPDYLPQKPNLRHELAQACYNNGDSRSVVKLLAGLHKHFAEYAQLIEAYELMAQAMADVPGMEQNVVKIGQLLKRLKSKKEQQKQRQSENKHAATPKPKAASPFDDAIGSLSLVPKEEEQAGPDLDHDQHDSSGDLPPIEFR